MSFVAMASRLNGVPPKRKTGMNLNSLSKNSKNNGEKVWTPVNTDPLPAIPKVIHPRNSKLSLQEGEIFVQKRLEQIGFMASSSQLQTPKDGNCFVHAILDQMRYDVLLRFGSGLDHSSLRKMIVSSLPARISSEQIIWIDGIGSTVEQWMINMSEDGCYCDHVFIQLASLFLNKKIIIIPVLGKTQIEISPQIGLQTAIMESYYVLYYSEAQFHTPHYQSIRPKNYETIISRKNYTNYEDNIDAPARKYYVPPISGKSNVPKFEDQNEFPCISKLVKIDHKMITGILYEKNAIE